jgi:hypothetical protein
MGHKIIIHKRFAANIRAGQLPILIRCLPSPLVREGCVLSAIAGDGTAIRVPQGLGDVRNGLRILSMRRISINAVSGAANRKHTKYEFSVCIETAGGEMHEMDGEREIDTLAAFAGFGGAQDFLEHTNAALRQNIDDFYAIQIAQNAAYKDFLLSIDRQYDSDDESGAEGQIIPHTGCERCSEKYP